MKAKNSDDGYMHGMRKRKNKKALAKVNKKKKTS